MSDLTDIIQKHIFVNYKLYWNLSHKLVIEINGIEYDCLAIRNHNYAMLIVLDDGKCKVKGVYNYEDSYNFLKNTKIIIPNVHFMSRNCVEFDLADADILDQLKSHVFENNNYLTSVVHVRYINSILWSGVGYAIYWLSVCIYYQLDSVQWACMILYSAAYISLASGIGIAVNESHSQLKLFRWLCITLVTTLVVISQHVLNNDGYF